MSTDVDGPDTEVRHRPALKPGITALFLASVLHIDAAMRRLSAAALIIVIGGFIDTPTASAQQSVNLFLGGFTPRAMDARDRDDVLVRNSAFLSTLNRANGIDIKEFSNVTVGAEWLTRLGNNFETGLGLGYYRRTVPTVYTKLVNDNGTEIQQDLRLRIVPFTATVRFLPFGHAAFEPYVGGGVGVYAWRYSETGQFVDTRNNIFSDSFTGSGGAVGPVVLGGVRVPIGPFGLGGEIRWQGGSATLPSDQDFAGSKLDLGGMNYLFIINVRF